MREREKEENDAVCYQGKHYQISFYANIHHTLRYGYPLSEGCEMYVRNSIIQPVHMLSLCLAGPSGMQANFNALGTSLP